VICPRYCRAISSGTAALQTSILKAAVMTSGSENEEVVPTEVSRSRTVCSLHLPSAHADAVGLTVHESHPRSAPCMTIPLSHPSSLQLSKAGVVARSLPGNRGDGHSGYNPGRHASVDSGLRAQVVRWPKARSRPMVLVISGVLPGAEIYQARLPQAPTTLLARSHAFYHAMHPRLLNRSQGCIAHTTLRTASWVCAA